MSFNWPFFELGSLAPWAAAALGLVVLFLVLKIVGKAISTTVRIVFIVGGLLIVAAILCALTTFLGRGQLPLP